MHATASIYYPSMNDYGYCDSQQPYNGGGHGGASVTSSGSSSSNRRTPSTTSTSTGGCCHRCHCSCGGGRCAPAHERGVVAAQGGYNHAPAPVCPNRQNHNHQYDDNHQPHQQHHHHHHQYQPSPQYQQQPMQQQQQPTQQQQQPRELPRKEIEIAPGNWVRFRGADETWDCIQRDFYMPILCSGCHTEIFCIQDADYVLCPLCRVVSPVTWHLSPSDEAAATPTTLSRSSTTIAGFKIDGGMGLGFTYEKLAEWQEQMQQEQQQQQQHIQPLPPPPRQLYQQSHTQQQRQQQPSRWQQQQQQQDPQELQQYQQPQPPRVSVGRQSSPDSPVRRAATRETIRSRIRSYTSRGG